MAEPILLFKFDLKKPNQKTNDVEIIEIPVYSFQRTLQYEASVVNGKLNYGEDPCFVDREGDVHVVGMKVTLFRKEIYSMIKEVMETIVKLEEFSKFGYTEDQIFPFATIKSDNGRNTKIKVIPLHTLPYVLFHLPQRMKMINGDIAGIISDIASRFHLSQRSVLNNRHSLYFRTYQQLTANAKRVQDVIRKSSIIDSSSQAIPTIQETLSKVMARLDQVELMLANTTKRLRDIEETNESKKAKVESLLPDEV